MKTGVAPFYFIGGTLRPDSPSYVERQADRRLLEGLLLGKLCYVLTARQMGKSSLMLRAAAKLRSLGVSVAVVDLTAIGKNLTPEQWYHGLLSVLARHLDLEDQLEHFWLTHERFGPCHRFFAALREVILERLAVFSPFGPSGSGKLVIFLDEIDVVRSLPFATEEFFAALRECYNRRVKDELFQRLTFCLLGIATPAQLIRDARLTPFHIGERIELADFTPEEAAPLAAGLPDGSRRMLERILAWTHGHPYLTQRLCGAVAELRGAREEAAGPAGSTSASRSDLEAEVDQSCYQRFLGPRAREEDDNLLYVRERIRRTEAALPDVLRLYAQIRGRRPVRDEDQNPLIDALLLSGIARVENGLMVVRNRIYYRAFDFAWIRSELPRVQTSPSARIAVLPFVDLSAGNRQEFLSDSLTDELIRSLGQVAGLLVAARTSAFEWKGKPLDVRDVGRRLNVKNVIEGSVRLGDSALEISVRLLEAARGSCVWSETLCYEPNGLLNFPGELRDAIASKLQARFNSKDPSEGTDASNQVAPARRNGRSAQSKPGADAYDLYLKGRYLWNKRTEADVRRSIGFFEKALSADPNHVQSHAGLADAYSILGIYNYLPPAQAFPKAKSAAAQALQLDDAVPEAHCALACTSAVFDWNWWKAEEHFKRAIELNPSQTTAHQWLGNFCLVPLARHDEALEALGQAQAVDPLSTSLAASVSLALYFAGRHDEAIRRLRETLELDPGFWLTHLFLGWALLETGAHSEALTAFQTSLELGQGDPVPLAALGHAQARAGKPAEACRSLDRLRAVSTQRYVPAMEFVTIFSGLGERDLAFQAMERALEERAFKLIYLKVDPKLNSLRNDPRFGICLERVGLRDEYDAVPNQEIIGR